MKYKLMLAALALLMTSGVANAFTVRKGVVSRGMGSSQTGATA